MKRKKQPLPLFAGQPKSPQGELSLDDQKDSNPSKFKPRVAALLGELRRTIERTTP